MTVRVAISGFGRIGRNIFRALYSRDDLEVIAINDLAEPKAIEYLLRFDSLHGTFTEPVRAMDGYLYAKGKRIPLLNTKEPGDVPWYDFGADVVVEATGRYRTRADLQKHLDNGASRKIARRGASGIGRRSVRTVTTTARVINVVRERSIRTHRIGQGRVLIGRVLIHQMTFPDAKRWIGNADDRFPLTVGRAPFRFG